VGRSPWPEWDKRGCIYLADQTYEGAYDTVPTTTEGLLIPEGTISVTRWLGNLLTVKPDTVFPLKVFYELNCFCNELLHTLDETKRRQFIQFGIEILGAPSGNSDVEAIYLIHACLCALGVNKSAIRVRVGDVAVFNRLIALSRINENDAIALKEALDAIAECKAGKQPGRRPTLAAKVVEILDGAHVQDPFRAAWIGLSGGMNTVAIGELVKDPEIWEGIKNLNLLTEMLNALKCNIVPDLCVVRSHQYYTGIAFEIDVVFDEVTFVEVGGGGRYDKLIGHFMPSSMPTSVPATGFAFGVERLVCLLDQIGLLSGNMRTERSIFLGESPRGILLVPPRADDGYLSAAHLALEIRSPECPVDIYLGRSDNVQEYARARGFNERCIVVI